MGLLGERWARLALAIGHAEHPAEILSASEARLVLLLLNSTG